MHTPDTFWHTNERNHYHNWENEKKKNFWRTHIQQITFIKKNIKESENSVRRQITQLKINKVSEQSLHQRRYTLIREAHDKVLSTISHQETVDLYFPRSRRPPCPGRTGDQEWLQREQVRGYCHRTSKRVWLLELRWWLWRQGENYKLGK